MSGCASPIGVPASPLLLDERVRAAWYDTQGPAEEVLQVGQLPDPVPPPGELRVSVRYSGVNPGDTKKRRGWLGSTMPYPRVVPHSDAAGVIDRVGDGVKPDRIGQRVWVYGAQSYRPFGTAAQYVTVPDHLAVGLPDNLPDELGACLGIPGITAHRAVFGDGPVDGATILVHGVLGAVGAVAGQLARWGGATVIGTVRRRSDLPNHDLLAAHHVIALDTAHAAAQIRELARGWRRPHRRGRLLRQRRPRRRHHQGRHRHRRLRHPRRPARHSPSGRCCSTTSPSDCSAATTSRPKPSTKPPPTSPTPQPPALSTSPSATRCPSADRRRARTRGHRQPTPRPPRPRRLTHPHRAWDAIVRRQPGGSSPYCPRGCGGAGPGASDCAGAAGGEQTAEPRRCELLRRGSATSVLSDRGPRRLVALLDDPDGRRGGGR